MKIIQADARTGLVIGPWSFLMSHALLIGIQIPHSKRVLNDAFNHICSMRIWFSTYVCFYSFIWRFFQYVWMNGQSSDMQRILSGFQEPEMSKYLYSSNAPHLRLDMCFFLSWCAATNRKQYVLSILPYDPKLPTVTC